MRRLITVCAALFLVAPALAFAEGEVEHVEKDPASLECTAALTEQADEECAEFWEHHINWWSWDYKSSPEQLPEHRHMPGPFGFALINFAVFGFIMYRLAARPLTEFVRTRHVTIKKDLDEAAALRKSAAAKLAEYEAKISGIDREIDTLVSEIRKAAEAEKARIVAAAAEQAARLKADAETQIRNEINRTRRELRIEAVNAAIAAAETVLREKLGADDHRQLADRYVTELEGQTSSVAARS